MGADDTTEVKTTRERLLTAACALFAEKGYRDTTVAEICGRAEANIAAVNYHFHSKDELYVTAWRHSFDASLKTHPPDGGVPAEAPAEQRFRGRIRALLGRMLAPELHEFRILGHEMANPTGLLAEAMHDAILPLQKQMFDLVRELLGEGVPSLSVRMGMMCVVGQCLHLVHREWHRRVLQFEDDPSPLLKPGEATIEDLADYIVRFSLAGLRGIVAEARAGEGKQQGAAP